MFFLFRLVSPFFEEMCHARGVCSNDASSGLASRCSSCAPLTLCLSNRRAFHIECVAGSSSILKIMITAAKDLNILEKLWGTHVHVSETLTTKASPLEVKNMTKVAQHRTNNKASMTSDSLSGITNLDATATIYSSATGDPPAEYPLRQVLMQFVMYPQERGYDKDQRLSAEIHQSKSPGVIVSVVVPNTSDSEVERTMLNLNKNFPALLTNILQSQGLPSTLIIIIIIVITLPLGLSAFGKEGVIPVFQKTHWTSKKASCILLFGTSVKPRKS